MIYNILTFIWINRSDIFRANGGNYHKFSVCIIDDAEKVKNIDLMIPVVIMAQKLILIGDSRSQIMKHKIISSKIVKKMVSFMFSSYILILIKIKGKKKIH